MGFGFGFALMIPFWTLGPRAARFQRSDEGTDERRDVTTLQEAAQYKLCADRIQTMNNSFSTAA